MSDDLHHPDGTHRTTARTANGTDVARHEAKLRAHTADGHSHRSIMDEVSGPEAKQRFNAAYAFTTSLVDDCVTKAIGDGSYTYDGQRVRAESFMVAGNGPSAWVWFVFLPDGDIDHCYVEYVEATGRTLVPVPRLVWGSLHQQLTKDQQERQRHGA